jgi:hypothetical protein
MADSSSREGTSEPALQAGGRALAAATGALVALLGISLDVSVPIAVLRGALAFLACRVVVAAAGRALAALSGARGRRTDG